MPRLRREASSPRTDEIQSTSSIIPGYGSSTRQPIAPAVVASAFTETRSWVEAVGACVALELVPKGNRHLHSYGLLGPLREMQCTWSTTKLMGSHHSSKATRAAALASAPLVCVTVMCGVKSSFAQYGATAATRLCSWLSESGGPLVTTGTR